MPAGGGGSTSANEEPERQEAEMVVVWVADPQKRGPGG